MLIGFAYIWITEIFFNNIIKIILPDFFCFHNENENEAAETHIHNIEIPRPKNRGIEIPRPKNCDM